MNDEVRQINLSDEELFSRIFERMGNDAFAKPLIKNHIQNHRDGDEESTAWIRRILEWD